MELNSTLVVQAINFLCTYAIMHYIVLRHAASSLQVDKKYTESLRSAIADRKVILEQKLLEKEDHWKNCQYQLVRHEPSQQYGIVLTSVEDPGSKDVSHDQPISQADMAKAIKESVAYITKIGDL